MKNVAAQNNGFEVVKNRRHDNKHHSKAMGLKPITTFVYRPVSILSSFGTKKQGSVASNGASTSKTTNTATNSSNKGPRSLDDINLVSIRNSFAALNEQNKVFENGDVSLTVSRGRMYYYPSFIPNVYKRCDIPIQGLVSALCNAPLDQHKQILGEVLYPLVDQLEHEHAAKVTGMILEMDTTEVLHLLESPTELRLMVAETMDVLRDVLNGVVREPMSSKELVSALVNTPTYRRRMILGENLYPFVNKLEHKHADEVTEKILELDISEVLYLLDSPTELKLKVAETIDVLRNDFLPNFFVPVVQQGQQGQRLGGRRGTGPVQQNQQPVPMMQQQMVPRGRMYWGYPGRNLGDGNMGTGMLPVPYNMGGILPRDVAAAAMQQPMPITTLASALANAPPEQQRMMLGENLYPLVDQLEHEHAAKVTGKLLEMDQIEVLHLLESPDALELKVAETINVLRNVQQANSTSAQLASLSLNENLVS
ncbi:polyadenylate-binding protein 8 [Artemisia annua]|uniref:Polyadenylate-binding protein 8 n=1 Tax=Artemisia annua TaxID=35608 RepID=A0A2U1NA45_ARTAN|nr:polyadenylate-binding protein 8 [Artemisia annua]